MLWCAVEALEKRVILFEKLRKAMRIALPSGRYGLNDEGCNIDIRTIEYRTIKFCTWLKETSIEIHNALGQVPFEQREVIVLHVHGDMKFKEIAQLQGVSIKTIQSRYRYGLEKLRSLIDSEVQS